MATATPDGARAHARAQEGTKAEAMPVIPARTWPNPPAEAAHLTWAETVAGGNYTHRTLSRGTALRLTDVQGDACAHIALYADTRPWERLNVADTVKVQWNAYLTQGTLLLSDQGRALATITEDTSGHHDALCGTSTLARNSTRYGDGTPQSPTPAGRELLKLAAAKNGLTPRDLPPTLSFFQGVRVTPDGTLEFTGSAGPGTSVTLRTEQDVTILIANVPHPSDPREDYTCTPLEVLAWRATPTTDQDPLWTSTPEAHRAYLNTAELLTARGRA
ncbi:urea amidolyase associated protein UAAP1 [Streptomyces sp. 4F14]|uniref:urea amidolyase associated protein UAAP1 n=1 Tax=Streptomyces sp. 4F14 TaxID=3394380 RepID=UPI003A87B111